MTKQIVATTVCHFLTPLGPLLAAATDRGLLGLHFHPEPSPTEQDLAEWVQSLNPKAKLVIETAKSAYLLEIEEHLHRYFRESKPLDDIALDLRFGTSFQRSVWSALCEIPFGRTWSYQQVAETVGRPRAARAVGQACGANPVPIVVPCHRVLASSGGLGGYGGGLHIKRFLLNLERADTKEPIQER